MKTKSFSGIFKKILAAFLVAFFSVFSPVTVLAVVTQPISAPISIPVPVPIPAATIAVSPTNVSRDGIITVTWSGIPNPTLTDFGWFLTNGLTQIVGKTIWINNCTLQGPLPTGTPKASGSCQISLSEASIPSGTTTLNVVLYSGLIPGQIVAVSNQFTLSSTPAPEPDLIILSATPSGTLTVGSYNDVNITIKNQGNTDARSFWVSANTFDQATITQLGYCYAYVDRIAAGQTVISSITNCKQYRYAGPHTIFGKVDEFNVIAESNETNNTYSNNFVVIDRLEITSLTPNTPRQGDLVTITGKGFVADAASNLVYVGDTLMPTQFNKLSADGKTLTFMLTTETPFRINSVYPVKVKTPNGPQLSNSLNITITSPTVLSSVTPSQMSVGDMVTLAGNNFGDKLGSVFLYDLNYKFVVKGDIQSWNDKVIQIKIPQVAVDKEYLVVVNGSYGGKFIYSSNALKIKVLNTPAKSDLVVSDIKVNTSKIGEKISADVTIRNIGYGGTGQVLLSTVIKATQPNGQVLGYCSSEDTINIAPNQTKTIKVGNININCPAYKVLGVHTVEAFADFNNVLSESNENNNRATISVKVFQPAVINSINPSSGIVGSTVTINGLGFGNNVFNGSSFGKVVFYNQQNQPQASVVLLAWNEGAIKIKVPPVAKGTYSVEVQTADGVKSNRVSFTVTAAQPVINTIWPAQLRVGGYLIMWGANFGTSGKINFYIPGSQAASASAINHYWSNSLIIAQIPASLKGNQMYGIQVRTLVGQDLLDSPLVYRYISK